MKNGAYLFWVSLCLGACSASVGPAADDGANSVGDDASAGKGGGSPGTDAGERGGGPGTAGSFGAGGGSGGAAAIDAARSTDDAAPRAPDAPRVTSTPDASSSQSDGAGVGFVMRLDVPCLQAAGADTVCLEKNSIKTPAKLGGDSATTYDVTIRFRGVIEGHKFSDASNKQLTAVTKAPYFGVNLNPDVASDPENSLFSMYRLFVTAPKATYDLNVFYKTGEVHGVDYMGVVKAKGGTALTLQYDDALVNGSTLGEEMSNLTKIVVPGVPPAPLAFNGQFLQADIVSVEAE